MYGVSTRLRSDLHCTSTSLRPRTATSPPRAHSAPVKESNIRATACTFDTRSVAQPRGTDKPNTARLLPALRGLALAPLRRMLSRTGAVKRHRLLGGIVDEAAGQGPEQRRLRSEEHTS